MSDLFSAIETLTVAKEIIGNNGPIEINSGIYSHNINMDDNEKGNDIYILGEDGSVITFEQLIKLLSQLDELADNLEDETGRTYGFGGIEKVADNKYELLWSS